MTVAAEVAAPVLTDSIALLMAAFLIAEERSILHPYIVVRAGTQPVRHSHFLGWEPMISVIMVFFAAGLRRADNFALGNTLIFSHRTTLAPLPGA